VARGAKITRSATDHSSEAATGCCMGQAWMVAEGLGLPHSWRAAVVTALTGFQSAMNLSTAGMRWVGTSALETMARGNRMTRPTPCADSGPLLTMPRQPQPHDRA